MSGLQGKNAPIIGAAREIGLALTRACSDVVVREVGVHIHTQAEFDSGVDVGQWTS